MKRKKELKKKKSLLEGMILGTDAHIHMKELYFAQSYKPLEQINDI